MLKPIHPATWINERDERNTQWGAFWNYPDAVMCIVQSDDLNWSFFGMEVLDQHCDRMEDCYQCWPLCAYCWFTTDQDGICDREECPTHEPWAWRNFRQNPIPGPPWFNQAYLEIQQAMSQNPWRPKAKRKWRAPLVPDLQDEILYFPLLLQTGNHRHMNDVWKSVHRLQVK